MCSMGPSPSVSRLLVLFVLHSFFFFLALSLFCCWHRLRFHFRSDVCGAVNRETKLSFFFFFLPLHLRCTMQQWEYERGGRESWRGEWEGERKTAKKALVQTAQTSFFFLSIHACIPIQSSTPLRQSGSSGGLRLRVESRLDTNMECKLTLSFFHTSLFLSFFSFYFSQVPKKNVPWNGSHCTNKQVQSVCLLLDVNSCGWTSWPKMKWRQREKQDGVKRYEKVPMFGSTSWVGYGSCCSCLFLFVLAHEQDEMDPSNAKKKRKKITWAKEIKIIYGGRPTYQWRNNMPGSSFDRTYFYQPPSLSPHLGYTILWSASFSLFGTD